MSAELLQVSQTCVRCKAPLTIEEMHYYAREDGQATCNNCEGEWLQQVESWRRGESEILPRNATEL